jgi:hypothetical protein
MSSKVFKSIVILSIIFHILACSCVIDNDSPNTSLSKSPAVFIGKVTNISTNQDSFLTNVTFNVTKIYKGDSNGTLNISTCSSSACCGYYFIQDVEYLVFTSNVLADNRTLGVSLCSKTSMLNKTNHSKELNLSSQSSIFKTGLLGIFISMFLLLV